MRSIPWLLSATLLAACSAPSGTDSSTDDEQTTHHAAPPVQTPPTGTSPDVRIIVEPGDHGSALVAAINAAATSVHMTMYLLSAPEIVDALIARHRAGVDVKVVLNPRFDSPGNSNQAPFDTLQTAGVPVVWSSSMYEFTHEKCVVIDGTVAWIMTMNASKSSLVRNREFLAVDKTAADVAEAEAQFAADFANESYTPSGALLMSPVTARPGITGLIDGAQRSLDFEVEELADPKIATALCNAATRRVVVRGGIAKGARSTTAERALAQLKSCGVTMFEVDRPYLHAKAIVADGASLYVGSANFSATSLDRNRELGIITLNADAVSAVAATMTSDLASATAL